MAVIYKTTLTPSKLELLESWLPSQPWYSGAGRELAKAGGFRLDDPDGEVGIEFMVITEGSGDRTISYHVPLTYRAAPLGGVEQALIGTAEHGVLGQRWVYDGTHDPVLVGQLLALLQGRAQPQAQSRNNTPDPSVISHFTSDSFSTVTRSTVTNDSCSTGIAVETVESGNLAIQVMRRLQADPTTVDAPGYVTATWKLPDGSTNRAIFATLRQ